MAFFSADDPDLPDNFREMFGPEQIDQQIRQAIQFCWMALPEGKKNIDELERQIRRMVDRAIRDMREDRDAFGLNQSDS